MKPRSQKIGLNQLTFGDMIDPIRGFVYQTGDLPRGGSRSGLDHLQDFCFSEQFYFGFAAHHLTEPNESLLTNETEFTRKFTGHRLIFLGQKWLWYRETETIISPNILYRMQGGKTNKDCVQKGPYVGGVWYRNQDAFIILLGVEVGLVKVGYSYDNRI